ncbi:MAG: hypothetical protein F4X34_08115 [Chloroflexi bacterium]|nr:hypothetical protein [Chloroflexota bacterium]
MHNDSNTDNGLSDKVASNGRRPVRRLDTPNRPVAITRFVFNTFKEAFLHPTTTSYIDRRTGKLVGRDNDKASEDGSIR